MAKTEIRTADAPTPVARFTQGVRKGNILQVAGQVAFDPATGAIVGDTVAEQTRQALRNVNAVLAAADASMDDVVMLRVYLTDTAHFAEMNEAYGEFVAEPYPARTTVYVGLPEGLLVEIDALAVVGD
ncbi:reactive intermediate/imine deaminase [Streptoalloteichus tenebrarius]|uniref:Reactive intermediate/imine deaminase n=1 Tax=Streptoalloteichus tenebrarius (strain ATCC 17920 / DSM 40477 / JCM 4838 / CBS 697.72 / NBRC 16177 / NCIMB 11028 / NRRL B-12390 / A12253. 1 / ISP 5477) TaxID=1933 RepID=A0ABT1HSH9_STRSD|nr:Rid family detoxifying hydrolase [Streptoalloteichus tenebrarius]MCP2258469.1 reactive intermediate/imine deaminase [Streptoalloteichus tenebrarius]BFF03641.1 RidA family protein [Streptoalloteichus tenebrarius]